MYICDAIMYHTLFSCYGGYAIVVLLLLLLLCDTVQYVLNVSSDSMEPNELTNPQQWDLLRTHNEYCESFFY